MATRPHGSDWSMTPSMTTFISVACGAGRSLPPKPKVSASSRTDRHTKVAEVSTPTSCASCWWRGVAPSRNPVLRSWEVSPEMDAAMATTQPTISAAAFPVRSVQPMARKIVAVPSSAAMVMPEVGLLVTPTRPTMRAATVTKKNANRTTQTAATSWWGTPSMTLKVCGTSAMTSVTASTPASSAPKGRSRRVRGVSVAAAPLRAKREALARKLSTITGNERSRVMMPAVATAPAPM